MLTVSLSLIVASKAKQRFRRRALSLLIAYVLGRCRGYHRLFRGGEIEDTPSAVGVKIRLNTHLTMYVHVIQAIVFGEEQKKGNAFLFYFLTRDDGLSNLYLPPPSGPHT